MLMLCNLTADAGGRLVPPRSAEAQGWRQAQCKVNSLLLLQWQLVFALCLKSGCCAQGDAWNDC